MFRQSAAKAKRRGTSTPADRTGPRRAAHARQRPALDVHRPRQGVAAFAEAPRSRRVASSAVAGAVSLARPPGCRAACFSLRQPGLGRFRPSSAHLVLKCAWCRAKRDFWQASFATCKANFQLVAPYLSTLAWARSQRLRACGCCRCCLDSSPPRLSHNFVGSDPLARGCAYWPAAVGSSTTIHLHARLNDAYSRLVRWRPLEPPRPAMASRGCPKILRALPRCGATET